MLSWHTPQSLQAELVLLATATCVIVYRLFGGKNEWLRTHGVILVTYYAFGGLAYDELEGWKLLDSAYFLTTTVTTVGYGDLVPKTAEGKLFTVGFALLGLVFVFAALSPLLHALIFIKDLLLKPCTPPDPLEADDADGFELEDLRAKGNWGFKYVSAVAGPLIIFVLGMVIGFTVMDLGTVDGIYWSMITMTTIGYGDISGDTWVQRAVLCLYLPTAVAALADALSAVQTIGTAKDLVYTDFAKMVDHLLLGEAGGIHPDPEETLTEAEFLVSVLKERGIVDDMTVQAIRLQFAHITRHNTWTEDESSKVVNDRCVFMELRSQGRILHYVNPADGEPTKTADGHVIERVNLMAPDEGFEEWKEQFWLPRVFDGKEQLRQVRLGGGGPKGGAPASASGKPKKPPPAAPKPGGAKGGASPGGGGANGGGKGPKGYVPLRDEGATAAPQHATMITEFDAHLPDLYLRTLSERASKEKQKAKKRRGGGGETANKFLWVALTIWLIWFGARAVPDITGHQPWSPFKAFKGN